MKKIIKYINHGIKPTLDQEINEIEHRYIEVVVEFYLDENEKRHRLNISFVELKLADGTILTRKKDAYGATLTVGAYKKAYFLFIPYKDDLFIPEGSQFKIEFSFLDNPTNKETHSFVLSDEKWDEIFVTEEN